MATTRFAGARRFPEAIKGLAAAMSLVAALSGGTSPSSASALFGWRVTGIPAGDVLNVRAGPSAGSALLVGYPEGTTLSLTGRCTGGIRLDAVSGKPGSKQQQVVRSQWCEVWLDPTGTGTWRTGWVRGRYIAPL